MELRAMSTPAKRRWLRFSSRTLLIAVTIVCVLLGWQVSIVRERTTLRDQFRESLEFLDSDDVDPLGAPVQPPRLSWIREAMGDRAVQRITYKFYVGDAHLAELRRAFPEAKERIILGNDFTADYILPLPADMSECPMEFIDVSDSIEGIMHSSRTHIPSADSAERPQQSQE
jgi:hypothetical protein